MRIHEIKPNMTEKEIEKLHNDAFMDFFYFGEVAYKVHDPNFPKKS